MQNKTEIIIFHLIYFGAISKNIEWKSVINWIEKNFNENNNSELFLDLISKNESKQILESINTKIKLNFNNVEVRNLILSFYNESLKQFPTSIYQIERDLVDFFNLIVYEDSNQKYDDFLSEINEDYLLREDGFSGSENLEKYLPEKLKVYKDYPKLKNILNENSLIGYEI